MFVRSFSTVVATVAFAFTVTASALHVDAQASDALLKQAMVAAEDARAPEEGDLAPILDGLRSTSADVQQLAVRALGRLERATLVPQIAPRLSASSPLVRAEAANALGQALQGPARPNGQPDVAPVLGLLRERLATEQDAAVRGVIYATLGRLPYATADDVRAVEATLVDGSNERAPSIQLGSAIGLEALFRLHVKKGAARPATHVRLRQMATAAPPAGAQSSDTPVRIRRVALAALVVSGGADADTLRAALKDADMQVRRIAVAGAGSSDAIGRLGWTPGEPSLLAPQDRASLIAEALEDRAPMVRYDALNAYAAHLRATSCAPIVAATKHENAYVALLAIDLLAAACPAGEKETVIQTLKRLADTLPAAGATPASGRVEWHRGAHALTSLASVARDQARALVPTFASHPVWQVRMYAARAAATIEDGAMLDKLADDDDGNVAAAAITGLAKVRGHAADKVFIAALDRPEHHVIRAAARALAGTTNRQEAIPALLATLKRITAVKLDNTRDARVGVVERLSEIGSKDQAAELMRYLNDFDPRIATVAAEALTKWTGAPHKAAPTRVKHLAPSFADVVGLESALVRITMASGGTFQVRLFPRDAPATVSRFVRLAKAGYYTGLTFHRVVPNWVIQGGSPGANELVGDSPFMKDEVGLRRHVRGALGISTRGRDTGDAQIFVDLCDNFRLDHGYTVFGEVTGGMEVVDGVIEGDVMQKIEILPGAAKGRPSIEKF